MSLADLLLVTSRSESFCLAALEAMACGVPVLARRVGGLPEVVEDGATGLLFDDKASAVDHALALLGDAPRRARMGRAGMQRAAHFDGAGIVGLYEAYYRQGLARKERVRWRAELVRGRGAAVLARTIHEWP